MRRSDSRPSLSPHFVAFAWRYHPCVLFAPSGRDARPWARGVGVPVPEPDMSVETDGAPRFLGTPRVPWPCSSTPAGSVTPGHRGVPTRSPRADKSEDSHDDLSRLNRTAWALAVYASQGGSPLHHARLASGCWPSSAGRDSFTRRVPMKGFRVRVLFLLSQASWRNVCLPSRHFAVRREQTCKYDPAQKITRPTELPCSRPSMRWLS